MNALFDKILVPIDGSEHSGRALETAIQIAKAHNSKLVLLSVYSVAVAPVANPEMAMSAPVIIPDASTAAVEIEGARNLGQKILARAEAKAKSEKIEVEAELAGGNAVDRILEKSKEGKFDLIVMGARGLSTIRKILIGSVSDGVIKNALCPVLIVK